MYHKTTFHKLSLRSRDGNTARRLSIVSRLLQTHKISGIIIFVIILQ